jgi:cobalt-zinc-cadmium efflux system membrane fusion protein
LAGIETVPATAAETVNELDVLGTIAYDAAKRAEVNARARGLVREILVRVGERVEKGAPLIRIESAEIGAEQAKLIAAGSRIEVASAARERLKALFEQGMAAQKDLQAAQLELDTALAEKAAAEAALGMVGVDPAGGSSFLLTAPLAGTCVRMTCTVGRMASSEEILCEIVDTRTMWAELDVPEAELLRVQAGQVALVSADVLGQREFRGTIDSIAPEIDPHTRTARALVRLENPDGLLRANLFVHARILLGEKHASVLVPRGALQSAKDTQLVFVELSPGEYEARRVGHTVGRGDLVELSKGVRPGERVVVAGSFLLKTETLKGEIGAGCCAED